MNTYTIYELLHTLHTLILPWMNSFEYMQQTCIECITTKGVARMCISLSPTTNEPIAIIENSKGPHYFDEDQLLAVCVATQSEKLGSEQLFRAVHLLLQDGNYPKIKQTFTMKASSLKWNPRI